MYVCIYYDIEKIKYDLFSKKFILKPYIINFFIYIYIFIYR